MKRNVVFVILCLTILCVPVVKAQQSTTTNPKSVPSAPFVVQPAGFFQPFVSNAPFYINSEYQANPAYVPNPPYNPTPNYSEPPPAAAPPTADQVKALQDEIQQLKAEVQRLRQALGVETGAPVDETPAATSATSGTPATRTVLVLRDGRRIEVLDYVIVNGALRTGRGDNVATIRISDLDVAATQSANGLRGVPFLAPQ